MSACNKILIDKNRINKNIWGEMKDLTRILSLGVDFFNFYGELMPEGPLTSFRLLIPISQVSVLSSHTPTDITYYVTHKIFIVTRYFILLF